MTAAIHPIVSSATKYAGHGDSYLNASVALLRAETLLDEVKTLTGLIANARDADSRVWFPWYGAEAYSYFSVGYVTCLEWHARSRLVDLLTAMPDNTRVDDVKGTITDRLVVQMVAQNATVAQLVGTSLKVGSLDRYLSVFDRLLHAFGAPMSAMEWLKGKHAEADKAWLAEDHPKQLDYLFSFRHQLVHEIGMEVAGHWNVRESWDEGMAELTGHGVVAIIRGLEAAVTRYAPKLFPNLLNERGYPTSQTEQLEAAIAELTARMKPEELTQFMEMPGAAKHFKKALTSYTKYQTDELRFLDHVTPAGWRYLDHRPRLRSLFLSQRLAYLQEVIYCADAELGIEKPHDEPSGREPDVAG